MLQKPAPLSKLQGRGLKPTSGARGYGLCVKMHPKPGRKTGRAGFTVDVHIEKIIMGLR